MNKSNRFLYAAVLILFVFYNIALFTVCGFSDHNTTFWMSYGFVVISMIASAISTILMGKVGNNKVQTVDWLFKWTIIRHAEVYLIIELIASILFMILSDKLPIAIAFLVHLALLAAYSIFVISCLATGETVANIETEVQEDTKAVRMFRVDISNLIELTNNENIRNEYKKLAEKFRYSDPVSSDATIEIEDEIATKIAESAESIRSNDIEKSLEYCDILTRLLSTRNNICKSSKK